MTYDYTIYHIILSSIIGCIMGLCFGAVSMLHRLDVVERQQQDRDAELERLDADVLGLYEGERREKTNE